MHASWRTSVSLSKMLISAELSGIIGETLRKNTARTFILTKLKNEMNRTEVFNSFKQMPQK